jgi:hypothetical protein
VGDYDSVLASFRRLRDRIRPRKVVSLIRPYAKRLKGLLCGMYSRMESHAIHKHPGVAQMIFSQVSGQAGESIYRWLEKQCRDYEVKETAPRAGPVSSFRERGLKAGGPRFDLSKGKGSGSSTPAPRRDYTKIQCHNCLLFGHFQSHCPSPKVAAADSSK